MTGRITCNRLDFQSQVGTGIHTGLRKAVDSPESATAWRAIGEMEGWHHVLDFLMDGLESMGVVVWDE